MPVEAVAAGSRWALLAAPAVALLWAGLLLGVSFLATPVKFTAQSLTLPVALDVGQATFHLLAKIEWVALALLVITAVSARLPLWHFAVIALVAACLLVQTLALLPSLDARVAAIIAGEAVPASSLHLAYVACEMLKLILLLGFTTAVVGYWGRAGVFQWS
ncbi:MAG: hypothetical protein KIS68_03485 [Bauldia sp.]|nr:hypothetical protein [Bauldia sp.]